ncbi:MAG: acyltransferase family protein [Lactobacillus sp.]|nr:acyltransferase family protein [Lactobacillus sp.]
MSQSKSKRRNQNIEIMRSILMMFIVMHHLTINGYGLQSGLVGKSTISISNSYATFLAMLNSIFVIGVNVFFLISGYFGIHFKLKRLLKLIAEVYFYSIVLNVLALLFGFSIISLGYIQKIIFPSLDYWFIYAYVLLYILSLLINTGLEKSKKIQQNQYIFSF